MSELTTAKGYNTWKNLQYMWREVRQPTKFVYTVMFLLPICQLAVSLISVFLGSRVVALIEAGLPVQPTVLLLAVGFAGVAVAQALAAWLKTWLRGWGNTFRLSKFNDLAVDVIEKDYLNVVDKKLALEYEKAYAGLTNSESAFETFPLIVGGVLTSLFGLVTFGSLVAALDSVFLPLLLLLLAALTVHAVLARRLHDRLNTAIGRINNRSYYLAKELGTKEVAKDTRVYNLDRWAAELKKANQAERDIVWRKKEWTDWIGSLLMLAGTAVLTYLVYRRFVPQVADGTMPLATLVFSVGAIVALTKMAADIVASVSTLVTAADQIGGYRKVMETPSAHNHGDGVAVPKIAPEISLTNVSFRFTEKEVLKGLNLTIKPGEKIALVGPNGAGKTTLVHVLTGLLPPSEGTVSVNGIPQDAFNIDDYYSMFSVIFQRSPLLDVTIKSYIVLDEPWDEARFSKVTAEAGVDKIAAALPEGFATYLVKELHADGVTLSGGEMQKLHLAQALYRDAPVLILDEPTSALDPLAEEAIYQNYYAFSRDRTSVFISHRLSSTRFCDRIVYLEDGEIREMGTHEELMALSGSYRTMFDAQAFYYQEKVAWEESETLQRSIAARFRRQEADI